jgi:hypothetical protein
MISILLSKSQAGLVQDARNGLTGMWQMFLPPPFGLVRVPNDRHNLDPAQKFRLLVLA